MATYKTGLCSICCVSYNHAKFLEQGIRSIWDGAYKNIEIVALDDGSTDGSAELLQSLARQSPCPMQVISQDNTGNVGKNFNTTFESASGEYLAVMALDDLFYPNTVSDKMAMMAADSSLAFVASSDVTRIDAEGNIGGAHGHGRLISMDSPSVDDLLLLEYEDAHSFFIQGALFRKAIVDAVGGFDEDITGDDIVLRTKIFRHLKAQPEYNFKILKTPGCYYRNHQGNLHKNYLSQIKSLTEYLERYWPERPMPKNLLVRVEKVLQRAPFDEAVKMFALNAKAASLLLEPQVQKALKKALCPGWRSLQSYIFKKEKLADGRRVIRILCVIKISYRKKFRQA